MHSTTKASAKFLQVRNLVKQFPVARRKIGQKARSVMAVNDVSFDVFRGEVLAVVGESGSGKSTLGRTILQLIRPSSGHVSLDGVELTNLRGKALRDFRQKMQIVFQDPFSSLNPHMRISEMLDEVLITQHRDWSTEARAERINDLLDLVGLPQSAKARFPHEFSGGQRQRIGIARAIAGFPEFLVADEAVSALDVSVQAQVLNLLDDLKNRLNLTILFISHDMAVVRHIATRVAVLYLGTLVEIGDVEEVLGNPKHPYTEALLSAVPDPHRTEKRKRIILSGDIPSPLAPPSGCVFRTRCAYAQEQCARTRPQLSTAPNGHAKACLRDDLALSGISTELDSAGYVT